MKIISFGNFCGLKDPLPLLIFLGGKWANNTSIIVHNLLINIAIRNAINDPKISGCRQMIEIHF